MRLATPLPRSLTLRPRLPALRTSTLPLRVSRTRSVLRPRAGIEKPALPITTLRTRRLERFAPLPLRTLTRATSRSEPWQAPAPRQVSLRNALPRLTSAIFSAKAMPRMSGGGVTSV